MLLGKDFREFVGLLNDRHVEYLVVGAFAVGAHGHPRYTGDIDIWVRPSADNADKVVAVIEAFGFAGFRLAARDFSEPGRVLQLGQPPRRIDVMTSIDGVAFETAYPRRLVADVEGLAVAFIGLEDLMANKRATGRPKDRIDFEELSGNT